MAVFYFVYNTTDFALLAYVQKTKITYPIIRKIRINQKQHGKNAPSGTPPPLVLAGC